MRLTGIQTELMYGSRIAASNMEHVIYPCDCTRARAKKISSKILASTTFATLSLFYHYAKPCFP